MTAPRPRGGERARALGRRFDASIAGKGAAASERDLHLGASFQYDVTATHALTNEGGGILTSTTLAGRLGFVVVGADSEGARIRAELAQPKRTDIPAQGESSAQGLYDAVLLRDAPRRLARELLVSRNMSGDVRRQLRAMVSSLQLVLGAGATNVWERVETDEAGQYVASYERTAAGISKTKLRYDLVRTPAGLVAPESFGTKYETRGASMLVADASGWPASLEEDGVVAVTFQGGRMVMSSKTKARLVAHSEDRRFAGSFEAAQSTFDADVDGIANDLAVASRMPT